MRSLKDNPNFINSLFWYLMSLDIDVEWEKGRTKTETYKEMIEINSPPVVLIMETIIRDGCHIDYIENNNQNQEYQSDDEVNDYDINNCFHYDKNITIKLSNLYKLFVTQSNKLNLYQKQTPSVKKFTKELLNYECFLKIKKSKGLYINFCPKEMIQFFTEKNLIN
jgi:hypothetical protein